MTSVSPPFRGSLYRTCDAGSRPFDKLSAGSVQALGCTQARFGCFCPDVLKCYFSATTRHLRCIDLLVRPCYGKHCKLLLFLSPPRCGRILRSGVRYEDGLCLLCGSGIRGGPLDLSAASGARGND